MNKKTEVAIDTLIKHPNLSLEEKLEMGKLLDHAKKYGDLSKHHRERLTILAEKVGTPIREFF